MSIYDIDLVRRLCIQISESKDPNKIDELLSLIQAILQDDQEELRVRLQFLCEKYASFLDASKLQKAPNES